MTSELTHARILVWLVAFFCLFLSACRIPISQHPLCDEATSIIDERLIGTWEYDQQPLIDKTSEESEESEESEKPKQTCKIVKTEGKRNSLTTTFQVPGGSKSSPSSIHTTHFGMQDFLTWTSPLKPYDKPWHVICRYDFDDADQGNFYLMDDVFITDLIESEKLAGKVQRVDGRIESIQINAKPAELREFITKHGDKCFDMEHPVAFRRIKSSVAEE